MATTIEVNTCDHRGFGNTTPLTDRQLTIIRRALALYASTGADGMTTETWNLHKVFVSADVPQTEWVGWSDDIYMEGDPTGY